ncbi:MAG: hypothetical protein AAF387_18040 [Pseudomonadota bacterium]
MALLLFVSENVSANQSRPQLLQKAKALYCAQTLEEARASISELFDLPEYEDQLPQGSVDRGERKLHAATVDIVLSTLLKTIEQFPELTSYSERVALQWNYCDLIENDELFDIEVVDGQPLRFRAQDNSPFKWEGYRKWGFFNNDPDDRYIPTILDKLTIGRRAYHQFLHGAYRERCFPHPETGRRVLEEPSELSIRRRLVDRVEQATPGGGFPYQWDNVCETAIVDTEHADLVEDKNLLAPTFGPRVGAESQAPQVVQTPAPDTLEPMPEVDGASITEQRGTDVEFVERADAEGDELGQSADAGSEIATAEEPTDPVRESADPLTADNVQANQGPLNAEATKESEEPAGDLSQDTLGADTTDEEKLGFLEEFFVDNRPKLADLDLPRDKSGRVDFRKIEAPTRGIVLTPTTTPASELGLAPYIDTGTEYDENGKRKKKLGLSATFLYTHPIRDQSHRFAGSFSWAPKKNWFLRWSPSYSSASGEFAHSWGIGYSDWRPGTWSFQLNHWGPILFEDGFDEEGAIGTVSYKVKSELLQKLKIGLSGSWNIPMRGGIEASSVSITMQLTVWKGWYVRTTASKPTRGGRPVRYNYQFGYYDWRPGKWRIEYANYSASKRPFENLLDGAITINRSWQF